MRIVRKTGRSNKARTKLPRADVKREIAIIPGAYEIIISVDDQ